MISTLLNYFTDPVLRAPTIGSILMCLSASLVGVVVYLRKESLIGEALSHATYPGVILGALFYAVFMEGSASDTWLPVYIMGGAFITSFIGIWSIHLLEKRLKVKNDAALCFVLSSFFGIGILLASQMQFTHTLFYKQVQVYLWGQTATMTDIHILVYALLFLIVSLPLFIFYKEIKACTFDRTWSQAMGLPVLWVDALLFVLVILSLITGIRSVGVVLMSAMLITPAVSARQFTNKLGPMFFIAGVAGMLSAYGGNILSFELSDKYGVSFPTGPMIVLLSSFICLLSLLFSPKRGMAFRKVRQISFQLRSLSENTLKTMWRVKEENPISLSELASYYTLSPLSLRAILAYLSHAGWVQKDRDKKWLLTREGALRAQKIIRLHRLWEVYLVDWVGAPAEKVHRSAEEMEHVLTKEVEDELSHLLKDPKLDPHFQPIPPAEENL